MKIESLSIKNMRMIGEHPLTINFDTSKNVTLIVGENGAGKTTILDGISYVVSPFVSQFPGLSLEAIKENDVHISDDGTLAPYIEIQAVFDTHLGTKIDVTRTRKGNSKSAESDIKDLRSYAASIEKAIKDGVDNIHLPILAYYGTDRGNIVGPERRRYTSKKYERWDAFSSSMESATNFKRFFAWFDLMEDEERRERDERRDYSYHSPILDAVRFALSQLLGEKYSKPRILTRPLRFVVNEKSNGITKQLRIEQLSAGYKITIAMVADIAARMAEANPQSKNPLKESGIVLIDEIDLHLHAKWQKEILRQLTTIFPNIQFIISTHSPLIVLGSSDSKVQLIRLKENDAIDMSESDLSTYDVSMILLSEAFSLPSVYSSIIESEQKRRKELLLKSKLDPYEEDELKALNVKLLSLPDSFKDAKQKKIDDYIFNWAKGEGIL